MSEIANNQTVTENIIDVLSQGLSEENASRIRFGIVHYCLQGYADNNKIVTKYAIPIIAHAIHSNFKLDKPVELIVDEIWYFLNTECKLTSDKDNPDEITIVVPDGYNIDHDEQDVEAHLMAWLSNYYQSTFSKI